jgi:hypothetical protein
MARRKTKREMQLIHQSVEIQIAMKNAETDETFLSLQTKAKEIADQMGHPIEIYSSLSEFKSGGRLARVASTPPSSFPAVISDVKPTPELCVRVKRNLSSIDWYLERLVGRVESLGSSTPETYIGTVREAKDSLRALLMVLEIPTITKEYSSQKPANAD